MVADVTPLRQQPPFLLPLPLQPSHRELQLVLLLLTLALILLIQPSLRLATRLKLEVLLGILHIQLLGDPPLSNPILMKRKWSCSSTQPILPIHLSPTPLLATLHLLLTS